MSHNEIFSTPAEKKVKEEQIIQTLYFFFNFISYYGSYMYYYHVQE